MPDIPADVREILGYAEECLQVLHYMRTLSRNHKRVEVLAADAALAWAEVELQRVFVVLAAEWAQMQAVAKEAADELPL